MTRSMYAGFGVVVLVLGMLFDLLTPASWPAGLVYLLPILLAFKHSLKMGRIVIGLVLITVFGDWMWAVWPDIDDAYAGLNAVLVMSMIACFLAWPMKRPGSIQLEDDLRYLLSITPTPAAVIDCTGRLRLANDGAAELFGREAEALIGLSLEDLFGSNGEHVEFDGDQEETNSIVRYEPLDGPAVSIEITYRAVRLREADRHLVTFRDVSNQQGLQEALFDELSYQRDLYREREAQLNSILKHADALIAIKDLEGRYSLVNQRLLDLWQASDALFVGHTDEEVAVDTEFGRLRHALDMSLISNGGTLNEEEHFPKLPGRTFYTTRFPITDRRDEVIGLGAISIDVTDVQRARRVIDDQKKSLQRSNRDLERYAHMAAHDLQEPLRMIGTFTELLQASLAEREELDPGVGEYLQILEHNATRGRELVRDLLSYAKLSSDWEALPVDLEQLAANAGRVAAATNPDAQVVVEPLPAIMGNSEQLQLLVNQLVSNGIKFNRSATPRVIVTGEDREHEWTLRVTDNGIGLDNAFKERVFEVFSRLESRDEFDGTGVGLAICRRVMELHQGRIQVVSQVGEGATFICSFPKTALLMTQGGAQNAISTATG